MKTEVSHHAGTLLDHLSGRSATGMHVYLYLQPSRHIILVVYHESLLKRVTLGLASYLIGVPYYRYHINNMNCSTQLTVSINST